MEVVSFVNPKRVPQMADAEALLAALPKRDDVVYIGLVLNRRGFERAQACGMREVNCVVVASDTFGRKNQGTSTEEGMQVATEVAADARQSGIRAGVTIAAAFGCPFEGEVPQERVADLAARLTDMGYAEVALADTIGAAAPSDVATLVAAVRKATGTIPLRCHFHNTRNTAVANAYAALNEGVRIFDSSCGGVGGCPFAPAATGNVATEDLLYMFDRMGLQSGVDIRRIIETAKWLEGPLQAPMPAMVTRAGLFPREARAQ
jgi:hydroxymethylglutaryl-CoA lyase